MKKILVLMAVGVLILGFSGSSAHAQDNAVGTVVFTENSSTDLTVTVPGSAPLTLPNTSSDHWTWALGGTVSLTSHSVFWWEPGSTSLFNYIELGNGITGAVTNIYIASDEGFDPISILNNGDTAFDALIINTVLYNVQFNDLGDTSAVPEPSTLLLLGSGLVGLVGWRWRRK